MLTMSNSTTVQFYFRLGIRLGCFITEKLRMEEKLLWWIHAPEPDFRQKPSLESVSQPHCIWVEIHHTAWITHFQISVENWKWQGLAVATLCKRKELVNGAGVVLKLLQLSKIHTKSSLTGPPSDLVFIPVIRFNKFQTIFVGLFLSHSFLACLVSVVWRSKFATTQSNCLETLDPPYIDSVSVF